MIFNVSKACYGPGLKAGVIVFRGIGIGDSLLELNSKIENGDQIYRITEVIRQKYLVQKKTGAYASSYTTEERFSSFLITDHFYRRRSGNSLVSETSSGVTAVFTHISQHIVPCVKKTPGLGFEPRYLEPKSSVLPLNDPG